MSDPRKQARSIPVTLADGTVCPSIGAAAEALRTSPRRVAARMRAGLPLEPFMSMASLARKAGLHPASLAYRLQCGMPLERALSLPRQRTGPRSMSWREAAMRECEAILDAWHARREA